MYLSPDMYGPPKRWWEKKSKGLLHFGHQALARSILAVEHFPYASHRYGGGRLQLPSQQYSLYLVRKAMERNAAVVVMRGQRRWLRDVERLESYPNLCVVRNKQVGTISARNCDGFEKVLRAIEQPHSQNADE